MAERALCKNSVQRHLESAHHLRYATSVQQSTATASLVCIFVCGTFYRLQCHPGKSGDMFFGVFRSVTECFQSVTDYLQPVTELGTPKNMAVALPGMTLQPLYK